MPIKEEHPVSSVLLPQVTNGGRRSFAARRFPAFASKPYRLVFHVVAVLLSSTIDAVSWDARHGSGVEPDSTTDVESDEMDGDGGQSSEKNRSCARLFPRSPCPPRQAPQANPHRKATCGAEESGRKTDPPASPFVLHAFPLFSSVVFCFLSPMALLKTPKTTWQ